jgi:hypothetical protein
MLLDNTLYGADQSEILCKLSNCFYLVAQVFVLFKVSSLEAEIQKLNGEQLIAIKENIGALFKHCITTLGHEHHIRVVYALQVLYFVPHYMVQKVRTCFC